MSTESLEALLDRLTSGDTAAAEQVFLAYEPYLRIVVRRQLPDRLRAKFDSVDIIQSVWADLLLSFRDAGCRFTDPGHLRAFLVKATRNRFIDRYRQHRRAIEHEQSLDAIEVDHVTVDSEPRPSEVVQADELWEQLQNLCPPSHREILQLKRQGMQLSEIAARTGLHPSSIRRILYDLARQLAGVKDER